MFMFRNPEIVKWSVTYLVFTACSVLGGLYISLYASLYIFFVCAAAAVICYIFTKKRYEKISILSSKLDEILHGNEAINFIPDQEGELALLYSEVYKMTVRLREQSELLQKEKNYLSDSIADISHQIRTPLTSIRMIVPRLGRMELTEQQRYDYMKELNRLLSRIEWQITALLKIARLESGTVSFQENTVSVKELLDGALEPLELFLEVNEISVDKDISSEITYRGDYSWSVEAVGNILKNSMEHMKNKGIVKITARENSLYTEIIINDTGSGIHPEDLPHLFERFYKGRDSGSENVGIGLALSSMIIKRQNGTIKAESRKGRGAEFQIRFHKMR